MAEESTTPDLVACVRAIAEAAERRDCDAILPYFGSDAVCEVRFNMGEDDEPPQWTWHESSSVRERWEGYIERVMGAPEHESDIEQFGNRVVLAVNRHFRRFDWGVVASREAAVYQWDDGLVTRLSSYGDEIDDAREAAERLAEERD